MSYSLIIDTNVTGCRGPEGRLETIEFAMRTNTSTMFGPWIPLRLTLRRNNHNNNNYGISNLTTRGYEVVIHRVPQNLTSVAQQVTICGENLLPNNASEIQFRWMNSVNKLGNFDIWAIFNVTADLISSSGDTFRIFEANNNTE